MRRRRVFLGGLGGHLFLSFSYVCVLPLTCSGGVIGGFWGGLLCSLFCAFAFRSVLFFSFFSPSSGCVFSLPLYTCWVWVFNVSVRFLSLGSFSFFSFFYSSFFSCASLCLHVCVLGGRVCALYGLYSYRVWIVVHSLDCLAEASSRSLPFPPHCLFF